jgi:hypothetical protein
VYHIFEGKKVPPFPLRRGGGGEQKMWRNVEEIGRTKKDIKNEK